MPYKEQATCFDVGASGEKGKLETMKEIKVKKNRIILNYK